MKIDTPTPAPERRPLPEWLIGLGIAVVVVAAILVGFNVVGGGDDPSFDTSTGTEATGPSTADIAFTTFDGTRTTLGAFQGKPVVLNFWASWCPACIAEMPDLARVEAEVRDQVTFIGLDLQETSRSAAEALVAQTGVQYLLGEDPDGRIYSVFGGIGMPTTVFIDADGNVVEVHSGTIFADDLRERIREHFGV